ncbi:MAG TPA: hexitol phosphatase HxpB [Lacibacter sp.]|nr:hexitol phosphatase HxpB [Lacibacter sp.]HMO87542.1 hexitol phosphatase HxpB [Lacibacter sp.]
MNYQAVLFDMDGLLIDSEPLWREAGQETLARWGPVLTPEQYHSSTGLRTEEWIEHWFHHFDLDRREAPDAVQTIVNKAIEKITHRGVVLPGAREAIALFREEGFRVGLATSSPMELVEVVLEKLALPSAFHAIASAGNLPYGKPHPQVFLNCAEELGTTPLQCIVFEDSFNGMIAAKAARMRCVVVPHPEDFESTRWAAADLKLRSLAEVDRTLPGRL